MTSKMASDGLFKSSFIRYVRGTVHIWSLSFYVFNLQINVLLRKNLNRFFPNKKSNTFDLKTYSASPSPTVSCGPSSVNKLLELLK